MVATKLGFWKHLCVDHGRMFMFTQLFCFTRLLQHSYLWESDRSIDGKTQTEHDFGIDRVCHERR